MSWGTLKGRLARIEAVKGDLEPVTITVQRFIVGAPLDLDDPNEESAGDHAPFMTPRLKHKYTVTTPQSDWQKKPRR